MRITTSPIIVLSVAAMAASTVATAQDGEPITIGAAIALSGIVEAYDADPARAAEMAIADINAAGGVLGRPLEMIYADTRSDFTQGPIAGMEVIDSGADVVIVTGDFDFGGGAARVANAQGILAVSPFAADPLFGVQGIGPYAFTFATASVSSGTILAEWAHDQGWETAYVLTQTDIQYDQSVSEAFIARWAELAGEDALLGEDVFSLGDASISAQITRLNNLAEQPDFMVLSTFTPAGPSALRQIRAAGIDIPVLSAEDMDGDYWLEAVPDLSDFYFVALGSLFGDDPRPEVNEFIARFESEHGNHPSTAHTLTGYSAIEGIARAIERAGETGGDALRAQLEAFDEEPLLVGPTTFSADTHINFYRPMVVMQVQGGEHSAVELREPQAIPGQPR
ncbi:MAG: ABC transporter substrate-binding protein [Azospirillaceae bacterium]